MAKQINDGEFWLPSDFLDDDLLQMEYEEEECIAGLTRKMSSTTFKNNTPQVALRTSPQSTLYGVGSRSFSSGGGSPEVPSPPSPSTPFTKMAADDALELLYQAAGQVVRLGLNEDCQLLKESVQEKAILIQQQLRAAHFYHLKKQQLMKLRQQQLLQQQFAAAAAALGRQNNRSRGGYGVRPPNMSCSSAWPSLQKQHQQQQRHTHNGMRAVFLNGANGRSRESTGTGVFLPRKAGTPNEPRKKPACSTVLLPARVIQALNLNLPGGYVLDNGDAMMPNIPRSHHYPQQPAPAAGHEIRLPQEWTY